MRQRWISVCAVAIGIMIWSLPAAADRPFDESALTGTYAFTTIQIRNADTGDGVAFCSGYGTITFDGMGEADIEGAERCSDKGEVEDYQHTREYWVGDEPFFFIEEPGMGSTQCQLLQRGAVLMCDGTAREPEMRAFHALGFKQ